MRILAIDPSGNFNEGKGTSGLCLIEKGKPKSLAEIRAKDFSSIENYWYAHINEISAIDLDAVVIEGYRLYNHKGMAASSQANSELETVQLIGAIKMQCFLKGIPLDVQYASEVKSRWNESVLVKLGILEQRSGNRYYFKGEVTNSHKRDALKHALHYVRYGRK